MGRFFTSSQIFNSKRLDKEGFIDFFCKKMEVNGYVPCSSAESEISYILRFADNTNWVTIASEAYEQGNQFSQTDTGRIAEMLNNTCINTIVVDSEFVILDLYDERGQKADSLIIGRADDYLGDDISQPLEKPWTPLLYFLSSKYISERPDFLINYINDTEFHSWVIAKLEKRKNHNLEILKEYELISE